MASSPRIVLYDIETGFNVVAAWGLYNDNGIPHGNILKERYIVSCSWKVAGEKTVHSVSLLDDPKRFRANPHDDYAVCKAIHAMFSGADMLVAHNGDDFDKPFVVTRLLYHGFEPLPPIPSIDTLRVAKRRFRFNSNRLDYLGKFLKVGRKQETERDLWLKVLAGDATAIRKMVAYNKQDVLLLERVFQKLRPYIPNQLNRQLFGGEGCPACGSRAAQSRGWAYRQTRRYRRYFCSACQTHYTSTTADKTFQAKVKVL